jgi:hypothetical protein
MNNPMQFMNMLKGIKSPKDAVINMIKTNNNPMVKNLVEMAEKGNSDGIENFARNMFKEQGRDFDSEIKQFMNNFK